MKLPRLLNSPREIPGANLWNDLVNYVRAITPQASSDIMVRTTSGGTTFEQVKKPQAAGGVVAGGDGLQHVHFYIEHPETLRDYIPILSNPARINFDFVSAAVGRETGAISDGYSDSTVTWTIRTGSRVLATGSSSYLNNPPGQVVSGYLDAGERMTINVVTVSQAAWGLSFSMRAT